MHAQAAPAAAPARGAQAVSPRQQQVRTAVDEAYAKYKGDTKGKNADYIPYLAQVNPNLFGIPW
jgi:Glutaminase